MLLIVLLLLLVYIVQNLVSCLDGLKARCIGIQLNYYFSKKYYFSIRIKQRIADSSDRELIFSSYLCMATVFIVSLYANITKIGIRPHHCRWTQISLVSIKTRQRKSGC